MKEKYAGITLCYCFFSLCVVLLHCGHLAENPYLHFFLKSILCRFAVPFFLISTGYFYTKQQHEKKDYQKRYRKKQWKSYLFWSAIYLPLGFLFIQSQHLSPFLYPVATLFALFYLGTYYHLWYFPALLFGLKWNEWLLKHLKIPLVLLINGGLFTLGTLETYSAFFQQFSWFSLYERYESFFYTTRNGLFFTPIFLLLSYLIYHYPEKIKNFYHSLKTKMALGALVLLESSLIYTHPGKDKNFFFFLLFLTPALFSALLSLKISFKWKKNWRYFGQQLFFIHPGIIFLLQLLFPHLTGMGLFFSVLVLFIFLMLGRKIWQYSTEKLFSPGI